MRLSGEDPEEGTELDFEAFCRDEHPRLVGTLSLYCGDPFVAEELAQETLARAYRDWNKIQGMAAPGAWAHRVAMNLAKSYFRRSAAERRARTREEAQARVTEPAPETAEAVTVRRAVANLPEQQRRMLLLRFYRELSVAEVASLTGRSASAVTSLTHRAVRALRAELGHDVVFEEATDVP